MGRQLEGREIISYNTSSVNTKKYDPKRDVENPSLLKDPKVYDIGADTTLESKMEVEETPSKSKKRKRSTAADEDEAPKKKKDKKEKKEKKKEKKEKKKDKKEKRKKTE